MKYYVTSDGVYLGGWDENPPDGAIEVPYAPTDARQVWSMPNGPWSEAPPLPYTLPVAVIWLRMSDAEFDLVDSSMDTAVPKRLRTAFRAATSLHSEGELFGFVRTVVTSALTATRASEILANPTGESSSLTTPEE